MRWSFRNKGHDSIVSLHSMSKEESRITIHNARHNNLKGVDVAIKQLEFLKKGASIDVAKVIKSAAANLRDKFQEERFENEDLFVKTIFVDEGVTLKRIQPAPQGRAHRINKRSCHITVVVAKKESELVTE